MANKKVLVLPGDGVGKELCDVALPVLEALKLPIDLVHGDIGWSCWSRDANPVPQATWDQVDQADAILLGAIASKTSKDAESALPPALQGKGHAWVAPSTQLNQRLVVFASVRPSFYIAGGRHPFRVNIVSRGAHSSDAAGDSAGAVPATAAELASLYAFAFQHAREYGLDRVTLADSASPRAGAVFRDLAAHHSAIHASVQDAQEVALGLATAPEKFGVIVADDSVADTLAGLATGMMGGMGLAAAAGYGKEGAWFQPACAGAGLLPGKNKANPAGMFLSIAMMLQYLGFADAAAKITVAVRDAVRSSPNLTCDLGGSASCADFGAHIIALVKGDAPRKAAAILCVGDELVNGQYQNTNVTEISAHLNGLGYKVKEHAVVADQRHLIARSLSRFLGEYDLVVVSGGLGPTSDDVTRFSVADAMQTQLEFRDECWDHIVRRMTSFNLKVREEDKVQAYIPSGSTVLKNTKGLASGFMLEKFGTVVAVLPGPPGEMKAMLLNTFQSEQRSHISTTKYEWKLMGLMETETHVFVNTLPSSFAARVKYLWRYPHLDLSVEVADDDKDGLLCVKELDIFLRRHTVSKDGRSALELLGTAPEASWTTDDHALGQLLAAMPARAGAPQYLVQTSPRLSNIGAEDSYTGSLEITCTAPNGLTFTTATPLRGAEVREYVKEFSAWSHLRSTRQAARAPT